MARLDEYDYLPEAMRRYLSNNGWHFSKKMFEFAVSKMADRNGSKVKVMSKSEVDDALKANGVELQHDSLYDAAFVYHMGMSDYLESSIPDRSHLAKYVKDVLDDKDGYDGIAFTRFYADCVGKGCPIPWDDVL